MGLFVVCIALAGSRSPVLWACLPIVHVHWHRRLSIPCRYTRVHRYTITPILHHYSPAVQRSTQSPSLSLRHSLNISLSLSLLTTRPQPPPFPRGTCYATFGDGLSQDEMSDGTHLCRLELGSVCCAGWKYGQFAVQAGVRVSSLCRLSQESVCCAGWK